MNTLNNFKGDWDAAYSIILSRGRLQQPMTFHGDIRGHWSRIEKCAALSCFNEELQAIWPMGILVDLDPHGLSWANLERTWTRFCLELREMGIADL